jgi:hypothetical protein
MSRETKVGMTVAALFLSLVGGVLMYKLYFTQDPLLGGTEEIQTAQAVSDTDASAEPKAPQAPEASDSGQKQPEAAPPPPEEPPVLSGRQVAQGESLPRQPEPPGPPPTDDPPVLNRPPVLTPPPPDEPAGPPTLMPPMPPGSRPSDIPMSPKDEPVQPANPSGPPMLEPPTPPRLPPEAPRLEPPPPERPAVGPAGELAEPRPPLSREPADPRPPLGSDRPMSPPEVRPEIPRPDPEPPPPALPPSEPNPGSSPKPAPAPASVPPPPPPTAFDRKYEVPVLGRPVVDSQNRSATAAVPQAHPASQRSDSSGIPLTVRPQPGNVRTDAGIPVIVQPPVWNTPDGRPPAHVESFDLEVYLWKPGDTYGTVSQHRYRSDRYQEALARFNRERDPRLANPQPGMAVFLPPAGYLERRYGVSAPSGGSSPRPNPRTSPGSVSDPQGASAVESSPIQQVADFRPAASPASSPSPGGKRYRVQPNDTIWTIAKRTLGSGERWPEILRLNRDVLSDVNRLEVGMVLRLPDDARVDGIDSSP